MLLSQTAHAGGIMPFGFWGTGARSANSTFDSLAAYRALFLNGEGSIGTLNAFLDSSSNNFAITKNGSPVQGTFSPFSAEPGKWASSFDGSTGYCYINSNSALNLGTGSDLTIEFWFYNQGYTPPAGPHMLQFEGANSTYGFCWTDNTTGFLVNLYGTSTNIIPPSFNSTNSISPGKWYHGALVRQSNVCSLFLNGVCVATYSGTYFENSAYAVGIGGNTAHYGTINWAGMISNLRVVIGSAIYSGTTIGTQYFTPPTSPLTAVSGTVLLTCQDNRFKDNSSSNLAITSTGVAKSVALSPFQATTAPYTPTAHGGSTYFNGTTDYLSIPSSSTLSPGAQDFCISFWLYSDSNTLSSQQYFITSATGGLQVGYTTTNSSWGIASRLQSWLLTTTATPALYQWNHICITRQSNNTSIFMNGVRVANGTVSTNFATGVTVIGADIGGGYSKSFISNLAFEIGTTSISPSATSITVPTSPSPSTSNTRLLCNFTNADLIDHSKKNNFIRSGTLSQGTFSPYSIEEGKWSTLFTGVAYYTTNGSKSITVPPSTALQLATGDFTIEFFAKPSTGYGSNFNPALSQSVIDEGTGNNTGWIIRVEELNIGLYNQGTLIIGHTPTTSTIGRWVHIAFTRTSGVFKLYIDGTLVSTNSSSTTFDMNIALNVRSDTPLVIGGHEIVIATTYFGSLSNLRILKGVVAYTGNFSPPKGALRTSGAASVASYSNTTNVNTTFIASACSLLTCQNSGFVDQANNATLTVYTGPKTSPESPFTPASTLYSPSVHGGSMYLATPGGLTTTHNHTLTGDFTAEAWIYPLAYPNDCYIITIGSYSIITIYNGTLTSSIGGTGSNYNGNGYGSIKLNCWTHLAVTRSGTTIRLFINGTQTYSYTSTNTAITGSVIISDTVNARYTGYISDARLINGTAIYSANFTPPTAPFSTTPTTIALLNFANSSIIDLTRKNNLFRYGEAQNSTTQKKFGNGSLYFDGIGDTLWVLPNKSFSFGTAPFTVECWFYYVTQTQVGAALFDFSTVGNALGLLCHANLPGNGYPNKLSIWTNTYAQSTLMIGGTTTLQNNTWYHMAITRDSSGVFRLFLNGQLEGSTYTNTADPNGSDFGLYIGGNINYNSNRAYTGYIDHFTVIPGKALYTTNFTPGNISGY